MAVMHINTVSLDELGFGITIGHSNRDTDPNASIKTLNSDIASTEAALKEMMFHLLITAQVTGSDVDVMGDSDTSFIGDFCNDFDAALDSLAIIHDFPSFRAGDTNA